MASRTFYCLPARGVTGALLLLACLVGCGRIVPHARKVEEITVVLEPVDSGPATIRAMLDAGVKVGLGVDGSASSDASNLVQEARQALLLARVREVDAKGMTAREALEIARVGGAQALGRDDIGHLAKGRSSDFIAFDTRRASFVGGHADPVAALVLCQNDRVDYRFVNGRKLVDRGQLTSVGDPVLAEKTRRAAIRLSS